MVASISYVIAGMIVAATSSIAGSSFKTVAGVTSVATVLAIWGSIGVVCGIIMIVGSLLMNSENKSRVRAGAILVLVFTIIGSLFTIGGFIIGFILGLVGSILGLTLKPQGSMQTQPDPSM